MLALKVSTDDGPFTVLVSRLETLHGAFTDFRPYWPVVLEASRQVLAEALDTEGASTAHGTWPALSPTYAAFKRKHFPGKKILEREGRLRADLVEGAESSVSMDPFVLTVVSGVPYGGYHQRGEVPGAPPRKVWDPTRRAAAKIGEALSKAIREKVFSNRPFILS